MQRSPAETVLIQLMLRELDRLRTNIRERLANGGLSDDGSWLALDQKHIKLAEAVAEILNSTLCRALAYLDFSLQTGKAPLVGEALALLDDRIRLAANAAAAPRGCSGFAPARSPIAGASRCTSIGCLTRPSYCGFPRMQVVSVRRFTSGCA